MEPAISKRPAVALAAMHEIEQRVQVRYRRFRRGKQRERHLRGHRADNGYLAACDEMSHQPNEAYPGQAKTSFAAV